METKESIYSEIRCDYLNPEGYWTVDAWSGDNENGKVIAAIDADTAKVFYVDGCSYQDSYAQKVISEKVREILKSKDEEYNKAVDVIVEKVSEIIGSYDDERAEAIVDSVQV